MALNNTRLTGVVNVTSASTNTLVYQNPSSRTAFVRAILIHNRAATTASCQINFVDNNAGALGTVAVTNRMFNLSLLTNETQTIELDYPWIMTGTNDAIYALSDTASSLNIIVLGDSK